MDVPERIEVEGGSRVLLTWADGATSELGAAVLRGACRCATCREPEGMARTAAVLAGDEPVTIREAKLVGGYAISFVFGPDGHGTGIYPFDTLRGLGGDPPDGR